MPSPTDDGAKLSAVQRFLMKNKKDREKDSTWRSEKNNRLYLEIEKRTCIKMKQKSVILVLCIFGTVDNFCNISLWPGIYGNKYSY